MVGKSARAQKRDLSTIIRLRIGHTLSPAHLKEIKVIPSPLCERCGENADEEHIINTCKFTDRIKYKEILQNEDQETSFQEVLRVEKPKEVATVAEAFKCLLAANSHIKL